MKSSIYKISNEIIKIQYIYVNSIIILLNKFGIIFFCFVFESNKYFHSVLVLRIWILGVWSYAYTHLSISIVLDHIVPIHYYVFALELLFKSRIEMTSMKIQIIYALDPALYKEMGILMRKEFLIIQFQIKCQIRVFGHKSFRHTDQ